jgi:OmpA-OmpF porin, OOP family
MFMKKIFFLLISVLSILSIQGQETPHNNYKKRPAIGVHFSLTDFKTASLLKSSSLNTVLLNKQWTKPRLMSPGLALSYMQGLSNHVDVQARLSGSFLDLPVDGRVPFNNDNFFAEGDISFLLKILSDKYWVTPYLSAGIGGSAYKGSHYGAYMPLGAGLQVNFYDEAFLLINTQYRAFVAANNNNHFFHSIGFAGNIGKPRYTPPPVPVKVEIPKDTDGDGIFDKDDACPALYQIVIKMV